MGEKADATPEVPPATFEVPAAPTQVSSKVNPDRVAAVKILEYNRIYTTVKVISDKLTHPCVIALSSLCILLLHLICALLKENQRESRLSKDLALTHSDTHIHHFPITFVLNSCCYSI